MMVPVSAATAAPQLRHAVRRQARRFNIGGKRLCSCRRLDGNTALGTDPGELILAVRSIRLREQQCALP
jgi:hypothetical protein